MTSCATQMRLLATLGVAALMLGVLAAAGSAATVNWTGASGTDLYWSTAGNWTGGPPTPPDATSDVIFTATGGTPLTVPPALPLTATNIVTASTAINTLWYSQPDTTVAAHVTQINPGVTLKISGNAALPSGFGTGGNYSLLAGNSTSVTIAQTILTGGGSLDVSSATGGSTGGDVNVSQVNGTSGTRGSILDLSGLSSFNAKVDQVLVGYTVGTARPAGTLYLAQSNTITANNPNQITDVTQAGLIVGYSSGNASGQSSYLYLGQSNTIYADSVMIGGRRSTSAFVQFNPAFTNSSLVMRAADGVSRVAWINIGDNTNNSGTGGTTNAQGTLNLTDGTADVLAGIITLGLTGTNDTTNNSTGTLTFNKGTIDATGMIVGKKAYTTGTIRSPGNGTVNVSGTGNLIVGSQGIVLASYLSGGSGTASGTLNFTGGTVTMGGDITDGGDGTNGTSTLKLDGAVLDMQGHRIGTSIPIDNLNLYSGTIKNVGGLNSVIGGAGLVKNWDGTTAKTLVLDGTNTYTGDTKVTGGTLKLASTVSLTSSVIDVGAGAYLDVTDFGPAGYTVAAGNTIKGSGTVNGSLNVLGTLSPGSSPGLLTVNGDVTLSGNYSAEIAGNAPGTGYDQLLVIGANRTVTLGGTLSVTSTYTPGASDMFWIIVNDDATSILSGAFSNYANGDPIPALPGFNIYYHADYSTNSLTGGNDVVLAIPEPATLLMLVIAAGLCLAFRRARKA